MGSFTSKGLDVGKDDIIQALGKPPVEGMVPIGDAGIYVSPHIKEDKPVSPFNCEAWPNSPFCGGNPWTRTPVGVEDIEFTANECGVSVKGTTVLAWTKMIDLSVGWIAPQCRKEYDSKRKVPTPLPAPPKLDNVPSADSIPQGFDKDDIVVVVIATRRFEAGTGLKDIYNSSGQIIERRKTAYSRYYASQLLQVEHPTARKYVTASGTTINLKAWAKMRLMLEGGWADEQGQESFDFELAIQQNAARPEIYNHWLMPPTPALSEQHYRFFDYHTWEVPISLAWNGGFLLTGRFGSIFPTDTLGQSTSSQVFNENTASSSWAKNEVLYIALLDGSAKNKPTNPDDYKKRDCCMQCCSGGQAQERRRDQDLSEIIKLLKEIRKTVGVDEFPAKVPKTFLTAYDNSGKAQPPQQITIDNIPQLQAWSATALEAVLGEMGAVIEIEDTDPTKEGNQGGKVVHKNMSELMLDCYSLVFDSWMMNHQSIQLHTKTLIQQSMTHRTNTQNYFALLALIDFFGFKPKEIKKKIPFTVSIGKETLEEFMKEKEEEVLVIDFDPNDPNCRSYQDDMIEVRHAVAMIRAQCWRKLNPDGSLGGQVIDLVKMGMNHIDKINSGKVDPRNPEGEIESDFDKFCEDAETQFSRITGINPEKPYGVPYANRPRITKLGGPSTDSTPT